MAIFGNKKAGKKERALRRTRGSSLAHTSAHDVIRAPWFSEKALIQTEQGVYAFAVPQSATKSGIATAIKELYKVEPRRVRIVNLPAKKKPLRGRPGEGARAARRKAYVYLNAGDTIQFG